MNLESSMIDGMLAITGLIAGLIAFVSAVKGAEPIMQARYVHTDTPFTTKKAA
ncbi:hypothetical protein [Candidatus Nitrospira bockiana]